LVTPNEQVKARHEKKHLQMIRQTRLLLTECSEEVEQVQILWECQFKALMAGGVVQGALPGPFEQLKLSNLELLHLLKGPKMRPLQKMRIRSALSSALSETFALNYTKQAGDGQTCYILDVASLYSYIGINFPMPLGKYVQLEGDDLASTTITFHGDSMYLNGCEIIGIIYCRVFPPRNLLHPLLLTEINGLTVGTLCRSCAANAKRKDELTLCQHTDMERSFVSTVSSCEMAYGTQLGYRFEMFEIMYYASASYYLRPFLTLLAFEKLRHSEFPQQVDTQEKKTLYCQRLNKKMRFSDIIGMELSPATLHPNAQKRTFFKNCLNVFLGTFGANSEKSTTTEFLEYYGQLVDHMKADRIVNIIPMSEKILQVTLKSKEQTASRTSNVSIAVTITSMARVVMHKRMCIITQLNGVLLRIATDALFFTLKSDTRIPFEIGEAFGDFKHQFTDIHAVIQVGVKNLSILFMDEQKQLRENIICSGVALSEVNESILSHSKYQDVVSKMFDDELDLSKITVKQVHFKNSIKKQKLECVQRSQVAFNNRIYLRRQFVSKSDYFQSWPHGWQ
jgi:hypothetical protein